MRRTNTYVVQRGFTYLYKLRTVEVFVKFSEDAARTVEFGIAYLRAFERTSKLAWRSPHTLFHVVNQAVIYRATIDFYQLVGAVRDRVP